MLPTALPEAPPEVAFWAGFPITSSADLPNRRFSSFLLFYSLNAAAALLWRRRLAMSSARGGTHGAPGLPGVALMDGNRRPP
jgi:hypothetical protein